MARIKKTSHSGTLSAPAPEPGTLHLDLKEMIYSLGGYRYVAFLIDEHTRHIFYDFIKLKSEVSAAVGRCIAAFHATVGTPIDPEGRPLSRPRVRWLHSDREGQLMSHNFREFRASALLHHTTSPPHDHDLNPIAERIIGLISEDAAAIRLDSHASPRLWPWIFAYAIDWHNGSVSSVGSSTADSNISPHQRFTHRSPQVMDLAAFGCRAVALMPPTHQHKPSLSGRGVLGAFLGRSQNSKGAYDILMPGNKIMTSSSVMVDEERFDWAPPESKHKPLTSKSHAPSQPLTTPLAPHLASAGSNVSAPSTYAKPLRLLNLFSGPYGRAHKLSPQGWQVTDIDNNGEGGGGWTHDLLNDELFAALLTQASAGEFDAIMIAFPCSTFSITRFFDATNQNGGDRGPPVIRTFEHGDGLPESSDYPKGLAEKFIDPEHIRELKLSNLLLDRVVELAIAARRSKARTTIILENPADRSPGASIASSPEFKNHGSIARTSAFKRLEEEADVRSRATFAYCRLRSSYQKYTTVYYTPEAGAVLDQLNGPEFQCNHERGSHEKQAGGRGADGKFVSADSAAYTEPLCKIFDKALTIARTGGDQIVRPPTSVDPVPGKVPIDSNINHEHPVSSPESPIIPATSATGPLSVNSPIRTVSISPPAASAASPPSVSPISFPSWPDMSAPTPAASVQAAPRRPHVRSSTRARSEIHFQSEINDQQAKADRRASRQAAPATPAPALAPLPENYSPGGTADAGYSPFHQAGAAEIMEEAVAEIAFEANAKRLGVAASGELIPVSNWVSVAHGAKPASAKRLPGGAMAVEIEIAVQDGELPSDWSSNALFSQLTEGLKYALRADSPDAPSTHAEAVTLGHVWVQAEGTELENHARNESWVTIDRNEVPNGRRIHKLIWVYKMKRDGTAKARLCVQGTTLQEGVDYDQVFSAALRHSSARALFAFAARNGCRVRSVDLVAAYLQGSFVDGEVVYCHLPVGYPETDSSGRPRVAKVQKPIYGIQQAGRRLQRILFQWLEAQGFVNHDDSDPCIFSLTSPSGEILTIGVYVDNFQIVHSAELDSKGRGPVGCAYNTFMDKLASDWDVTDEGPMDDLLGMEIDYNDDGSIKLHQTKYIEKLVEKFLPDGPLPKAQRNSLPYSKQFLVSINDAIAQTEVEYPELLSPMQSRVGSLMYATTSTRPDIAFPVHQLCKCLHKPTPAIMDEIDHVLSYLARNADIGLTYSKEHVRLAGFADASWEAKHSTSGWLVKWQSAALTWGSRKQKSIALSTCEAEIIALSEATKDVVYLRRLVKGLQAEESSPTPLSTDSKSARDVSYNPEHHDRMKHVQRRHFFVRDMVEAFEIEVPYVPTNENPADFFTKPMENATKFREFRKAIMNTPY